MRKNVTLFFVLAVLTLLPCSLFGQDGLVVEPSDPNDRATFLNAVISADTTATGERAREVYILKRDQIYLLDNQITVSGKPLRLQAEDGNGGRPTIYGWLNATGERYPLTLFAVGHELYVQDLNIVQWFEPQPETISQMRYEIFWMNVEGASLYIDNCVLSGSQQMIIQVPKAAKTIKVTNTIMAQAGNLYSVNQGNGRHFDLRNSQIDTLIIQNCTLTDNIDRVIRHRGSTAPLKYLLFDHNTVVNGWGYHGCLELGEVGDYIQITNNAFVDPLALGNDSTDNVRLSEFEGSGELDQFGNPRMTLVSCVPNDSTQFDIRNNYYSVTDTMQAFYDLHSDIGLGNFIPLTWFLNKQIEDSTTAFQLDEINLTHKTHTLRSMSEWYWTPDPDGPGKDKKLTGFTAAADMQRPLVDFYSDKARFDLTYNQSAKAYTGAQGYPAGDLNWYPDKKAAWEENPTSVNFVNGLPTEYSLEQNYPNPFNPATVITYNIPNSSLVTLEVFNILGQKVTTLVNSYQQAGRYKVEFNASQLATGVYVYRLSAQDVSISKKMMLVK